MFVNVCFTSVRKEARASEVRKAVERDPAWSWLLLGDSSYLNRDVRIMCGDSELRQINLRVNPSVAFLCSCSPNLLE
jgi:hypothetical protein